MDSQKTANFIKSLWDGEIIPALTDYIRIPNKSPAFDPDWEAHGHMEKAVTLFDRLGAGKTQIPARRHAGSGAPARPHAADLDRGARQRPTEPS